jgi:hypothetical protein
MLSRRRLLLGAASVTALAVLPANAPRPPGPRSYLDPRSVLLTSVADRSRQPGMPLPAKVVGVYWTGWDPGTRLTALPDGYNLLYLFAAHPGRPAGAVRWSYDAVPVADLRAARARGKQIILSCGGAGGGIRFTSRDRSAAFVESIKRFDADVGGTAGAPMIDGVDYNTFEAEAAPNLFEYLWISDELRRHFGPAFVITSPPAPWSQRDKSFCRGMLTAGAMSYAAPQFYGGRDLEEPDYIVRTTDEWVRDVAGGDASKIVIGFGLNPGVEHFSTATQVQQAWDRIASAHPDIGGAFLWQDDDTDRARNLALSSRPGRSP